MTFDEAMVRASAAHKKVRSYRQPGNDYVLEHECSEGCGSLGSILAVNWDQHIVDAADALLAAGGDHV